MEKGDEGHKKVNYISAVIIAKNEAERIARAITSVRGHVNEVLVIDGGSTDETVRVSKEFGAQVIENPWPGYAAQRNFGAAAASNDWIFMLDSDEEINPEIATFLGGFLTFNTSPHEVFAFNRVGDFLGVLLPGNDRTKHIRLYNRLSHRYKDVEVHETVDATDDQIKLIRGLIIHHGFRSINDHVNRFNIYTDLEAKARFSRNEKFSFLQFAFKPPVRFFYQMISRKLWRRGLVGIFVSLLWVYYDIIIQMKLYELEWKTKQASIAISASS